MKQITMGSSSSKTAPTIESILATTNKKMNDCLRIERMIASELDFLPNRTEDNIRVGVLGRDDPTNPLSGQAIKIGDSEAYRLKSFQEGQDSLHYTFEKGVSLTIMKRRDSVVYNLKTPELDISREINPSITKMFKTIDMDSAEIDKIGKIFQMQ